MNENTSPVSRFIRELRRRHVFRTAALYIVGTWLVRNPRFGGSAAPLQRQYGQGNAGEDGATQEWHPGGPDPRGC